MRDKKGRFTKGHKEGMTGKKHKKETILKMRTNNNPGRIRKKEHKFHMDIIRRNKNECA